MRCGTMRRNNIYTPDGIKVTVDLEDPKLIQHLEDNLIAPYQELIENNWLDSGKKKGTLSMEERVKKYLERLGTMLLQDPGEYVILTDSMQRRIAMRETELADYLEDKPQSRSKRVYRMKETSVPRSQKLREIQIEFPGKQIDWRIVDTEGVFEADGIRYRIDHPDYAPVKLSGDLYYPLDAVGVLRLGTETLFFTQTLDKIQETQITCLAIPDRGTENNENGGIAR